MKKNLISSVSNMPANEGLIKRHGSGTVLGQSASQSYLVRAKLEIYDRVKPKKAPLRGF